MPSASRIATGLLAVLVAGGQLAAAHMEMQFPAPFRSKYNPNVNSGNIDYSMTSPLNADGSNFPCKGYQSDIGTAAGKATASFAPGGQYNFTIVGGASHGGGSCQASLSYDGGKTFTVIQSIVGGCPVQGSGNFDFTVPSDAKTGDALFVWTWNNNLGNREMYMNCAAVTIGGGSAKREEKGVKLAERAIAFSARPQIFVANVGNGCGTVASADVIYPDPGPDVVTNKGAAQAAPTGNCGVAAVASSGSSGSSASGSGSTSTTAAPAPAAPTTTAGSGSGATTTAVATTAAATTVTKSLSSVTTSTQSSTSIPGYVPSSSATSSPALPSTSTEVSVNTSTSSSSSFVTKTIPLTVIPVGTSTTANSSSSSPSPSSLSSVTGSGDASSPTESSGVFMTVPTGGATTAKGTGNLTIQTSTAATTKAGVTTAVVPNGTGTATAANPTGTGTGTTAGSGSGSTAQYTAGSACTDEGAWNCVASGSAFQRCASGVWSVQIPMAPGTSCTPGMGDSLVWSRRRARSVRRAGGRSFFHL